MNQNKLFIIISIMMMMSSACSSLDMPEVETKTSAKESAFTETRSSEEPLLSFESEAAFLNEVQEIARLESKA